MKLLPTKNKRAAAYFYLLINTLCWGAALVFVKPAFDFTTPYRFLFYRYLLASMLFAIPYFVLRSKQINWQQIKTIALIETLGTVFNLFVLYYGLSLTSAIEASLIGTTGPVFITLAGILLLKERQEKFEWLGLGFSLIGTILIVLTNHQQASSISLMGNLLILAYNLLNALYLILAKKYYKNISKSAAGAVSFLTGFVLFSFIVLLNQKFQLGAVFSLIRQDWQHTAVVFSSIYMAIFGSIIGLIAYIKGQDKIEASEAGMFIYLQPAIYLPLGIWVLNEKIYLQQLIGLALVLLGVIAAEKFKWGRKKN